jgi:PAS domain S-box-containing protein
MAQNKEAIISPHTGSQTAIRAEVLGQLLLMQNVLINLPTKESIFNFVCRGLIDVPGVQKAEFFDVCKKPDSASDSDVDIPIGKKGRKNGILRLKISNPSHFSVYEHYVMNFMFMIEVILEERHQRKVIDKHQAELEETVEERTLRLLEEIKERKTIEESLKNSIALLRIAGEKARLGGWIVNFNEDIIYWSDEVAAIHEVQAGFNPTVSEGINFYAPEWRKDMTEVFDRCATQGISFDREIEIITARGRRVWVRVLGDPIRDSQGNIVKVQGAFQDISERKENEERLRQGEQKYRNLVEQLQDGVYRSCGKKFQEVNQSMVRMLGYTSKQDLLDADINTQLFYAEDLNQKNGGFVSKTEEMSVFRMRRKDGTEIWVQDHGRNIMNNKGEFLYREGTLRDITEQKQAEEARRQVEIARESARIKQNFLANMSHEIRTPLTGVLGMIEILEYTELTKQQKGYVNTLKLSGENLKEIINQVLDFSKIEAGKTVIKSVVFEPRVMINDAETLYESITSEDVRLYSCIDPDVPQYIRADRGRVFQVINNLLSNARKFTHEGSIQLKVNLLSREKANRLMLKVEVKDTGIGIPEGKEDDLFTPFSQIETNDTRTYEGTGLGLAICKELVMLMGGEIGVSSVVNKGSTFWFTFPATAASADQIASKYNTEKRTQKIKLRILFAEDKAINQKVVSLMLRSMGHEISVADHGEHALDLYEPGKFDIILMDIQMPVMDGITATRKLKTRYKNLPPIIGLSANAFEGDREKYMALGMDEYLTKPLKMEDFTQVVAKFFPES